MTDHTPFLILGGGAAAFSAATRANDLGIHTVMINAGLPLGGTCVNVGCVPSKNLLSVAEEIHATYHPRRPGGQTATAKIDYVEIKNARDALVADLRRSNYTDVLGVLPRVELIEGRGAFVNANTVSVGGRMITADKILVAVGSRPVPLPVPGGDSPRVLNNRTLLALDQVPESLVVLGGSVQGLEFGQAFARLGAKVTILQRSPHILSQLDRDIGNALQAALEAEGITIYTGTTLVEVQDVDGGVGVRWRDGESEHTLVAAYVLNALGVVGNADGIDASRAGLQVNRRGFIDVNDAMKTGVENIYAAGDVIGRSMLEHAAAKEGVVAADNLLAGAHRTVNYGAMPAVVFTDPQVAYVGLTESAYMKRHGTCYCRTVTFDRVPRAKAAGRTEGIVRLAVDHTNDKLVGAQIVSPAAGEAIHEAVLAIQFGLTVDDIIETVHAFPTYSEAIKTAALAFRRDVRVMACCIA